MPTLTPRLPTELLADPKERAEHVMLVDLGRNDLGRVCEYGTVKVSDFFTIEKYSHVMHIVSHVEGKLRPGLTCLRSGARRLPRWDGQRRAESPCLGDHLRTRTRCTRRLCRHGRLLRLRRQHGYLSRHPHDGGTWQHVQRAGRRRHRRRFRSAD